MQIQNVGGSGYDNLKPSKVKGGSDKSASPSKESAAASQGTSETTRADRIAQLKASFQAGKPVDLNRLANTLAETGIFFDEKA